MLCIISNLALMLNGAKSVKMFIHLVYALNVSFK